MSKELKCNVKKLSALEVRELSIINMIEHLNTIVFEQYGCKIEDVDVSSLDEIRKANYDFYFDKYMSYKGQLGVVRNLIKNGVCE